MALVQQLQKTKQQANDISVLTEQANSAIVTPPVAQPALSAAATAPAQPTPEMMQQVYAMMQQYPSNVTGNHGGGRSRDRDNRNVTGTVTCGRGGRAPKRKATTHQPPSPTEWEEVIPTAYLLQKPSALIHEIM